MAEYKEEIAKIFSDLHCNSVRQNLHEAAVELLVTQHRQPVKPEAVQAAKTQFKKQDPKLLDKYNELRSKGNPLVDHMAVVLHQMLLNRRISSALAVPGSSTAALPSSLATPLSVNRLSFAPSASPATPLTTPGPGSIYPKGGLGAATGPIVNPQRLFQSPPVAPAGAVDRQADKGGGENAAPQQPGLSRLAGTNKNPLYDARSTPEPSAMEPSGIPRGRDLVPPLTLHMSTAMPNSHAAPAANAAGRSSPRQQNQVLSPVKQAGQASARVAKEAARVSPPGAPGGTPGVRARLQTTASSRARQISRDELLKRAAAREAKAAAARGSRPGRHSYLGSAEQPTGEGDGIAAEAANDGGGEGGQADGDAFGNGGDELLQALQEGGTVVPPPGFSLSPDALAVQGLATQFRNPMYNAQRSTEVPFAIPPDYTPKYGEGVRTRRLEAYKLGPAIADCGDLFQVGQPPEGPPHCPDMPEWWMDREYQTTDFIMLGQRPEAIEELEKFPQNIQEYLLINDLLYTFVGFHGTYVYPQMYDDHSIVFQMDSELDPSLMELVSKLLPLSEYVAIIQRFVETRSGYCWGLVAQAVAACMGSLLDNWEIMVMQLEHQMRLGRLSLQALFFHCQQPLVTLRLLASIAADAAAQRLRGARLLNLLHAKQSAAAGDMQARWLVQRLLQEAARPYFHMLNQWMCQGTVEDPNGEFMVQEDQDVTKASLSADEQSAYWLHKYTLRVAYDPLTNEALYDASGALAFDVPVFLYAKKDTILTTGKYLNAIRECGRKPVSPLELQEEILYDAQERHMQQIERAFRGSSAQLLNVMKHEMGLLPKLRSMKQYFLCDRGDLLLAFMDIAEEELNKKAHEVSTVRLQSMLDLAVRTSSAAHDPHSEDLKCLLDYRSLLGMLKHILRMPEQLAGGATGAAGGLRRPADKGMPPLKLGGVAYGGASLPVVNTMQNTPRDSKDQGLLQARTGREAFLLTYHVEWPLTVVISEASLTQYQLVFRHLFELKHVERELNNAWRIYQTTKDIASAPNGTLRRCYGLCQQMSHFFREYLLYLTFEVLEPLWHNFEQAAAAATNIDEVVQHHQALLRRIMKGCLLSRRVKLLRTLVELKALALKFAEITNRIKVPDASLFEFEVEDASSTSLHDFQKRKLRAQTVSDLVRQSLESSAFDKSVRDLQQTFDSKFKDFIFQIGEIYKTAQKTSEESREELESLLNLINRLDFNDWLAVGPKVNYRAVLEGTALGMA